MKPNYQDIYDSTVYLGFASPLASLFVSRYALVVRPTRTRSVQVSLLRLVAGVIGREKFRIKSFVHAGPECPWEGLHIPKREYYITDVKNWTNLTCMHFSTQFDLIF